MGGKEVPAKLLANGYAILVHVSLCTLCILSWLCEAVSETSQTRPLSAMPNPTFLIYTRTVYKRLYNNIIALSVPLPVYMYKE